MKTLLFRVATLLFILAISYFVYYLLLYDKILISIPCIISYAHGTAIDRHLLILGLLPIYIGVMVFGATFLGILAGNKVQQYFNKPVKMKRLTKK